jgi:O-antigen ligase
MGLEAYWGIRFLFVVLAAWAAAMVLGFETGVTILASVGFAATLVGIVKPTVGLFGIGILSVMDAITRVLLMTGGLFRYNSFNYVLLLALMVCFPKTLKLTDNHTRLLIGFALLMVLGLATSPDVPGGAFGLLNLAAEFGLLLYFLRAREEGTGLFWLAVVNSTVSAVGCVVFFTQMSSIRPINPNAWAYMPVTGLFSICLAYPAVDQGWKRTLLLALSLLNCGCVFLSASRGSMLVSVICVIFLLSQTKSNISRLSYVGIGGIALVSATALFPSMQAYALHRVDKLFDDSYSMGGRTSGRSELAEAGIQMFLDNPFGRGTGAFAAELSDIEGYSKQSHSGWIKTMVENGIVGVTMFAAFLGSFAYFGWKNRRRPGAKALGLLVTVGMGSAFFSTEFNSKGLWFLAAGATAVLAYPARATNLLRLVRPQAQGSKLERIPPGSQILVRPRRASSATNSR